MVHDVPALPRLVGRISHFKFALLSPTVVNFRDINRRKLEIAGDVPEHQATSKLLNQPVIRGARRLTGHYCPIR